MERIEKNKDERRTVRESDKYHMLKQSIFLRLRVNNEVYKAWEDEALLLYSRWYPLPAWTKSLEKQKRVEIGQERKK